MCVSSVSTDGELYPMVMRRMSPRVMAVKLMMITTYIMMMVSLVYCTSPGAKAAPKRDKHDSNHGNSGRRLI